MSTIKILVIGPPKTGKTSIANILADMAEGPTAQYKPTIALRIVEFEKEPPVSTKKIFSGKVLVELWDVSGDTIYEKCWPAILKGTQGIIFCYDPSSPSVEKDVEFFVNNFPKAGMIPPKQCMGYANHFDVGSNALPRSKPPNCLKGVALSDATAENTSTIYMPFDRYFSHLLQIMAEK